MSGARTEGSNGGGACYFQYNGHHLHWSKCCMAMKSLVHRAMTTNFDIRTMFEHTVFQRLDIVPGHRHSSGQLSFISSASYADIKLRSPAIPCSRRCEQALEPSARTSYRTDLLSVQLLWSICEARPVSRVFNEQFAEVRATFCYSNSLNFGTRTDTNYKPHAQIVWTSVLEQIRTMNPMLRLSH